jgi:hypothetical protein
LRWDMKHIWWYWFRHKHSKWTFNK